MPGIPKDFPLETFEKYTGLALPRHVSYPMPTAWSDKDGEDFLVHLEKTAAENPDRHLSLYLHIPFCETLCKFCACTRTILKKTVTGAEAKLNAYLSALLEEIRLLSEKPGAGRPVGQIHWGGGSPAYLTPDQIRRIQGEIVDRFEVRPDAEIAMEVDPRNVTEEHLQALEDLGFNRISMGIQDFNPKVQEHVHRIQPFELVEEVTHRVRDHGLGHVNYDLIYGMPYQTEESVRNTVEKVITLRPDRIAFYHYAQIPEKIATQRGMDYTRLPSSREKLAMFLDAIEAFTASGYEFIGLDHFALPHDELAKAYRNGTIQRNFQGMTTHGGLDLLGMGVSSISHLIRVGYWQSEKEMEVYENAVMSGEIPRIRGIHFSEDDIIRQQVLSDLYCYGRFDPPKVRSRFGIDPETYFEREIVALHELAEDGLVEFESDGVVAASFPLGRVLLRNIGAVFDNYLDPDAYKVGDRYYFSVSA